MRTPVVALVLLTACAPGAPAGPSVPTGERITIPSLGLRLSAPPPYAVYSAHADSMVIDLNPGGRTARMMSLAAAPSPKGSSCSEEATEHSKLTGGDLAYRLERKSGGSGGAEETLYGCWQQGERSYTIRCDHQDEWRPDARFCLTLLATAEVIEVADAPPTVGPGGLAGHPLGSSTEEPTEPEPAAPVGLEKELYEGFRVVLTPGAGQVWLIKDLERASTSSGFQRTDDFWAVPAPDSSSGDFVVWLEPMVDGKSVSHHDGPYDSLLVTYSALKNPPDRARLYIDALRELTEALGGTAEYRGAPLAAKTPERLRADIESVVAAWQAVGVEPGSVQALRIDL